jgi:hypothetical protein
MRRGSPPLVTVGSYRGEAMEVILQPVNDPRYRTNAAYPKFVPARMAKAMGLAAKYEADSRPENAPQPKPQRDFSQR